MMTVMGIHPQCQRILDITGGWRSRPLEQMEVAEARIERAEHLADQYAFAGEPEPVAVVEDRIIPNGDCALRLRLYRPASELPLPVLVFAHGGGWVFGDLDSVDRPCRVLANAVPAVVISVDYRLAPEARFPIPCEDVYRALEYAAANAATFGADGSRIALGGDSAGGNLAAAVSLMARDRNGPAIDFQLLIYPATDAADTRPSMTGECSTGFGLTRAGMEWFWRQYAGDPETARHPYASPVNAASLRGLPPALIITAEYDPLRDQGEAYGAMLSSAGVPVITKRYAGMIHGFYPMRAAIDAARQALDDSAAAIRGALERPR